MHKIISLLVLLLVIPSAFAMKCTQWVDGDGVQRWKCEPKGYQYVYVEPKDLKVPRDVRVSKHPNGDVVVFDYTNGLIKSCTRMFDKLVCR